METLKGLLVFLVVIAIIAAIFYGLWKWIVSLTTKRSQKMNDEVLFKAYKGTGAGMRWAMAAVAFLFCGGPLGAVYFYFMFKKMHDIYYAELLVRGNAFDKVA